MKFYENKLNTKPQKSFMIYRCLCLLFIIAPYNFIGAEATGKIVTKNNVLKTIQSFDFGITRDGSTQNWESAKICTIRWF